MPSFNTRKLLLLMLQANLSVILLNSLLWVAAFGRILVAAAVGDAPNRLWLQVAPPCLQHVLLQQLLLLAWL
jgi:hypothetical protein